MVYGSTLGLESDTLSIFALDVVSDADLIRFVENLKKQIRILCLENEVLEATIMRLQPSLMTGVYSALEYAMKISHTTLVLDGPSRSRFGITESWHSSSNIKSQSRISNRRLEPSLRTSSVKISRSIIGGTGPKINVEERLELVFAVMENQGKDLKKFKSTATKRNAYLKGQLEEIGLRTIDIEHWTLDFEQEVMIGGVEMMTKRIAAETWIRFMTEHCKKIDRKIDKLRLRTSTANIQHRKLKEDIKVKKELVSRLLPVDIELKTIHNKVALEIIERKTKEIVALKSVKGDANLNLTRIKNDMMAKTNYLKKLQQLTDLRKVQTVKLGLETTSLEEHVKIFEERLNWIQELRNAYFVPEVLDYVRVKLDISELNHSIKLLETSLSIKLCAITSFKRKELTMSKEMLLSNKKKPLKSTGGSTKTSDMCKVRLRGFNALKKGCRPCGLLPRK